MPAVSSTLLALQTPTSTPTFAPEPPRQTSSAASSLPEKNTQPTSPPPSFSIWIVIFLAAIVAISFMILLVRCARKRRLSNQIVEKEAPSAAVGPNTLTPLYVPLAANAMRPNNDPVPPLANKFESSLLAHGDSQNVSQYRPALIRGMGSTRMPAGAPGGGLPSKPRPWSLRATQA